MLCTHLGCRYGAVLYHKRLGSVDLQPDWMVPTKDALWKQPRRRASTSEHTQAAAGSQAGSLHPPVAPLLGATRQLLCQQPGTGTGALHIPLSSLPVPGWHAAALLWSRWAAALPTFSTRPTVRYQPLSLFLEVRLAADQAAPFLPRATWQPLCHQAPKAQALHTCPHAAHLSPRDQPTGCTGAAAPDMPLSCLQSQMAAPLQGSQLDGSPSLPGCLQAWSR